MKFIVHVDVQTTRPVTRDLVRDTILRILRTADDWIAWDLEVIEVTQVDK